MNLDIDPLSTPWPNKADPGRGDIVVSGNGRFASFEYRLPEDPDDIRRSIAEIIQADEKVTDRSLGKDNILEVK